jgi:hypothetical protein
VISVLSLGPHINVQGHPLLAVPLPWWIPAHLPVLDDILPNRLMVYVDLAAAIMVAFTLRLLWLIRRSPLLNVALAVVVLLPLMPTLPTPATRLITPAAFASRFPAAISPGDNVLFEPLPSSDYAQAMDWQASAHFGFTIVGGYIAAPYAPGVDAFQRLIHSIAARPGAVTLSATDRGNLVGGLRSLLVRDVVVGNGASPGVASLFTQLFGTPPIDDGGFLIWQVPVYHG